MDNPKPRTGLLLCDDMISTSRISGTGNGLGFPLQPVRSVTALLQLAGKEVPRCVIVDLATPKLDINDLVSKLRAVCAPMPFVAAFGSHVDTATLRQAREAGCNIVWPRSKFFEELAQVMPLWFQKG